MSKSRFNFSVTEWRHGKDIYQVSPWDQLAWDLGQDLGAEPSTAPRVFKSHLRCLDASRPDTT